jgi:hypothetical protein
MCILEAFVDANGLPHFKDVALWRIDDVMNIALSKKTVNLWITFIILLWLEALLCIVCTCSQNDTQLSTLSNVLERLLTQHMAEGTHAGVW